MQYTEVNFYKGTSAWLSFPALAIEWPNGMLSAPCTPRNDLVCARVFS
jgi:hypothetical protein